MSAYTITLLVTLEQELAIQKLFGDQGWKYNMINDNNVGRLMDVKAGNKGRNINSKQLSSFSKDNIMTSLTPECNETGTSRATTQGSTSGRLLRLVPDIGSTTNNRSPIVLDKGKTCDTDKAAAQLDNDCSVKILHPDVDQSNIDGESEAGTDNRKITFCLKRLKSNLGIEDDSGDEPDVFDINFNVDTDLTSDIMLKSNTGPERRTRGKTKKVTEYIRKVLRFRKRLKLVQEEQTRKRLSEMQAALQSSNTVTMKQSSMKALACDEHEPEINKRKLLEEHSTDALTHVIDKAKNIEMKKGKIFEENKTDGFAQTSHRARDLVLKLREMAKKRDAVTDEAFNKLLETSPDIRLYTETINRTESVTDIEGVDNESDSALLKPKDLDSNGYSCELNVFYCSDCGYTFAKEKFYKWHKRDGICVFKCQFCDQVFYFRNYSAFKVHTINHRLEEEKSIHKDKLEFECHFKDQDQRYSCHKCPRSFRHYGSLRRHAQDHMAKLQCHCGATFMSREYLRNHQRGAHEEGYHCDLCPEDSPCMFRTRTALFSHKNKEHSEKYKCEECGFKFGQRHHLEDHILATHSKAGPRAQCIHCGAVFNQARSLTRHLRAQTCTVAKKRGRKPKEPEPRICEHCGKTFRDSGALLQHRQTHNDASINQCTNCGAVFKHKQSLSRHKRNMPCKHRPVTKKSKTSMENVGKKMGMKNETMNDDTEVIQELVFVEIPEQNTEEQRITYGEVKVVSGDEVTIGDSADKILTAIVQTSDVGSTIKTYHSGQGIDNPALQNYDGTEVEYIAKVDDDSNLISDLDKGAVFTISSSVENDDTEFTTIKDSEGRTFKLVANNVASVGDIPDRNTTSQNNVTGNDVERGLSNIDDTSDDFETEQVVLQIDENYSGDGAFSLASNDYSNVYSSDSQNKSDIVNKSKGCRLPEIASNDIDARNTNLTFQGSTTSVIISDANVPSSMNTVDLVVNSDNIVIECSVPFSFSNSINTNSHTDTLACADRSNMKIIHIGQNAFESILEEN